MEILFITHKYPPSIGGMQKMSEELVKGIGRVANVHVIAPMVNESKVIYFIKLRSRVKKILSNNPNCKLIHLIDGLTVFLCPWLVHLSKEFRVIATLHGLDVVFPSSIYRRNICRLLNKYAHVVCVSEFTKGRALQIGLKRDHLSVIKNGVSNSQVCGPMSTIRRNAIYHWLGLSPDDPRSIIIGLGRLVSRKGFSWFVRSVMPKISDQAIFVLIGPGGRAYSVREFIFNLFPPAIKSRISLFFGLPSDGNEIRRFMSNPKCAHTFRYLGAVSEEDKLALLHLATCVVMPNISVDGDAEGFGLVALEASIQNKLVVVSPIEGITDAIVHGQNGIFCESSNTSDWISQLLSIFAHRTELVEFGNKARFYTQNHYSWSRMVQEYSELFAIKRTNVVRD